MYLWGKVDISGRVASMLKPFRPVCNSIFAPTNTYLANNPSSSHRLENLTQGTARMFDGDFDSMNELSNQVALHG